MKTYDQGSSLFWLLLSTFAMIQSLRMGIGTLHNPGMGLMPFGASGLLGILSLTLFIRTSLKKERAAFAPPFSGTLWKRVILVVVALLLYANLMAVVGYLLGTFLLMTVLFWILERKRVWLVLIFSFLTSVITYCVFSVWLQGQYPQGFFGH